MLAGLVNAFMIPENTTASLEEHSKSFYGTSKDRKRRLISFMKIANISGFDLNQLAQEFKLNESNKNKEFGRYVYNLFHTLYLNMVKKQVTTKSNKINTIKVYKVLHVKTSTKVNNIKTPQELVEFSLQNSIKPELKLLTEVQMQHIFQGSPKSVKVYYIDNLYKAYIVLETIDIQEHDLDAYNIAMQKMNSDVRMIGQRVA